MTRLHWIAHLVAGVLFVAIAFNALLATTPWSTRADLTIIGGTLEVIGLALLALDLFGPSLGRGWEWLTMWGIKTRIRDLYYSEVVGRLTGTRAHVDVTVFAVPGEARASGIPPTEIYGEVGSLEAVNHRLRDIAARISSIETQNAADHKKLSDEIVKRDRRLRRDVDEWIAKSRDRFLPWRLLGFALALSGTVVLAAANVFS